MAEIDDILKLLKDYDRRLRSLETTPQPPNILSILSSTSSFTLSASAADWASVRIFNDSGNKMLAVPSIVVYKDSVAPANRWPDGSNWASLLGQFQMWWWLDPSLSDGADQMLRLFFINFSGGSLNLIFQVGFRFLMKGSS